MLAFLFFDMDAKRAFKRRKDEMKAKREENRGRPPTPEEPEWVTKMKMNREVEKVYNHETTCVFCKRISFIFMKLSNSTHGWLIYYT